MAINISQTVLLKLYVPCIILVKIMTQVLMDPNVYTHFLTLHPYFSTVPARYFTYICIHYVLKPGPAYSMLRIHSYDVFIILH